MKEMEVKELTLRYMENFLFDKITSWNLKYDCLHF